MSVKSFVLAIIISLVLSAICLLINLIHLMPTFLIYFCVAFAASIATLMLNPSSASGQNRKTKKVPPATPINDGQKETGSVKWFNPKKGFGFIARDEGGEIFVHFRSISETGQRALREGQRVSFSVSESDKGLQAEEVTNLD